MCSPFSATYWRRGSTDLSSTPLLSSKRRSSQLRSINEQDVASYDRESDSFRAFSSFGEILSLSRPHDEQEKRPSCWRKLNLLCKSNAGLALTTLSGIFFALASLFVKLSNTTIPAFEIIFVRLFLQTIFVLPPAIYAGANVIGEKKQRIFLTLFGAFNFLSISSVYGAFTLLPLGDATVFISTTPVFTGLLAYFILKESWRKTDAASSFLCLVGIILITRPTFIFGSSNSRSHMTETHRLIGYVVASLGAIIQSATFIMVRSLDKSISFYTNVFYFGWCSALLSGISMFIFQNPVIPDCGKARWYMLSVAIFGVLGSLSLNRGLQLENAAPAALMRNVDILFAFVFDVVFFEEQPHPLTVIGGLIVCIATTSVVITKMWRARERVEL
ncbi:solute carrier family 35 member G1-like [Actinia tenebrosa]|uniref:Solute carrier family 35 member G1-like n=1 Tax=Actinia tenebrosa TaxID=6105 RepID=A0A6P8IN40_ACTTE|nr:solute carrier family 35 member G1-like [Actinia tenebrosa]